VTASTCPACGAETAQPDSCDRCGYVRGERFRCPHCRAEARTEARVVDGTTVFSCAVCGGPRAPGGLGGEVGARHAREARTHFRAASRAAVASFAFGAAALLVAAVATIAWPAALAGKLAWLAVTLAPALFAVRSRTRVGPARASALASVKAAHLAAAKEAAEASDVGATAKELATRLGVTEPEAEALLVELSAADVGARIDVDDDAEVRFRLSTYDAKPTDATRVADARDEQAALETEDAEDAAKREAAR
jgi:hypothetical protein